MDGICHIYVEKNANLKKAKNIILNSKMRRPGICGAAETLLIDKRLSNNLPELFLLSLTEVTVSPTPTRSGICSFGILFLHSFIN